MGATRFTRLLGCRHPLQQAGMGGCSSPELALAVSEAGALGMLSGTVGLRPLRAQLDRVPPHATVGVNFLIPFLDRDSVEEAAQRSRFVEFFWGAPDAELVGVVHAGGALAAWQVGSADEARAARDAGCDVIVAQGLEAGGHVRGTTALLPLLDEVRASVDVPIVAAGGIGTGRAMAAALVAGADAVRVGTRFVAATESVAHPEYIQALIDATADDTVITTAFGDGWPDAPHRVLRSCIVACEALGSAQSWSPDPPTAECVGPVEARALYAGQSVGAVVARQSAAEIVAELVQEAETVLYLASPTPTPRRARPDEAGAIADLWLRARYASIPAIPPPAHSDDEVREWFASVVVPSRDLWVLGHASPIALLVFEDDWIDQLYVDPEWTGRGVGSRLIDFAKDQRERLDLWTFQSNVGARRFYERHGFVAVEETDGDNEEHAPDVHYRWSRELTRPR
jgi:NAD(P)H-dependent flavin oxidoreductase YrpB (nitropropane dioxygenase family)/GNAT superfamily N-acetyltransferase